MSEAVVCAMDASFRAEGETCFLKKTDGSSKAISRDMILLWQKQQKHYAWNRHWKKEAERSGNMAAQK